MKVNRNNYSENQFELILSYLLFGGVILSLCLEVIGIILYYRQYGNLDIALEIKSLFVHGQNFFTFLYNLFQTDASRSTAVFFMALGMATLILTPYLRVIASFLYYLWQRNFKYVMITGFVLVVITISLIIH